MTRALVVIADAEPEWTSDGQPVCSQSCPSHDGKRCQLIGFRPSMLCEPAVVAMADEIRRLRLRTADSDRANASAPRR